MGPKKYDDDDDYDYDDYDDDDDVNNDDDNDDVFLQNFFFLFFFLSFFIKVEAPLEQYIFLHSQSHCLTLVSLNNWHFIHNKRKSVSPRLSTFLLFKLRMT